MLKSNQENRWYVKIIAGKSKAMAQTVYYRHNLTHELFFKYLWYFEYRAALYKVQKPRYCIELTKGTFTIELPKDEHIKKLKDNIAGKKRKITIIREKIKLAKEHWTDLFPIEETDDWKKANDLLKSKEFELRQEEATLEEAKQSEQPLDSIFTKVLYQYKAIKIIEF